MSLSNKFFILLVSILIFIIQCQNCDHLSNLDKISVVKQNIIHHFANNTTSFVDLQSVLSSNWFFERYLHEYNCKTITIKLNSYLFNFYQDNEKNAEKAIIHLLDYFQKEGLYELNDTYFPSEAYAVGAIYRFGESRFGQPLLGAVMSHIKPFGIKLLKEPFTKLTNKFCIYNIYKTLFQAKEKNFIVYVVMTNTSLDNTELSENEYTVACKKGCR